MSRFSPSRLFRACWLVLFLPLSAAAQEPAFVPAAPDPLFQNRVSVPHSAASLQLRVLSGVPGLAGWEFFKECQDLTDAQLQTLAMDLERALRHSPASPPLKVLSGVVDGVLKLRNARTLVEGVREQVRRLEWKDSLPGIRDEGDAYDPFLLDTLAAQDLAAALSIAEGIRTPKTRERILMDGAQPDQTPAWLTARIAATSGIVAARSAVASLPAGPQRALAEAKLAQPGFAELHSGKKKKVADLLGFGHEPGLARLAALDAGDFFDPSYPVLAEILKLSPAEAGRLVQAGGADLQHKSRMWLRWGLLMRMCDADPDSVLPLLTPMDAHFDKIMAAMPYARLAHRPDMEKTLRAMPPGDMRDAAVMGYLSAASLHDPARLIALARDLAAPATCWRPLLIRLARSGAAPLAFKTAATLPESDSLFDSGPVEADIMRGWALTDLPAAVGSIPRSLTNGKNPGPGGEGLTEAFACLPAHIVLESLDLTTLAALSAQEIIPPRFWLYLATEDIEAGFRFFERVAVNPAFDESLKLFASVAARYQPERAKALLDLGTAPIDGKEAAPR